MPFDSEYYPPVSKQEFYPTNLLSATAEDRIIRQQSLLHSSKRWRAYLFILLTFILFVAQVGAMTPMTIY